MDKLSELAIKYKTDKGPPPGAHPRGHNYTPIYNKYFKDMRFDDLKILEIGVGGYGDLYAGGESLRMWADYFPVSQITSLDIEPKNLILEERVKIYQGSQTDHVILKEIISQRGPFDIIIDDGSHLPDHHIKSFDFLFTHGLKSGGIYIVEDLNTSYEPGMRGQLGSSVDYFKEFLNVLHAPHMTSKGYPLSAIYDNFHKIVESIHAYNELIFVFKK